MYIVLIFTITLTSVCSYSAYSRTIKKNTIETCDRPYLTSSTSTVNKNCVQIETGYSLKWNNQIINHNIGELLVRTGVINNLELRFGIDSYSINDQNDNSRNGKTDGSIGFKLSFIDSENSHFILIPDSAILVETKIPTGTPVLREKAFQPSLAVLLHWKVRGRFNIRSAIQYSRVSEYDNVFNSVSASLSLTASINHHFRTFLEYMLKAPAGYNGKTGHMCSAGIICSFSSTLIFDSKVLFSIESGETEYLLGAGACAFLSFQ